MKILFIGDPHLKITCFQQSVALLKWIEEVAAKHKPDVVCNLGDTFHTHAVVRSELLKEFRDHVNRVLDLNNDIKYWYVLGNHDQFSPKNSKYHALQTFNNIDRFTVFDETHHDMQEGLTIVPYVNDRAEFPTKVNRLVITHNTFIGADYGFKVESAGIDSALVDAELIVSGHIHKQQSFGRVIYPGTPYASSINDIDEEKGLMLLDTKDLSYSFIKTIFPTWKSIKFTLDASSTAANFHDLLKSTLDSTNTWVIYATGVKAELVAYFDSNEYKNLCIGKNVSYRIISSTSDKVDKIQIKAVKDVDIIAEYVDKIYSGTISKSKVTSKAIEILKSI